MEEKQAQARVAIVTVLIPKAFGNSTVLRFAEAVKVFRSVCHSPDSGVNVFEASGRRVSQLDNFDTVKVCDSADYSD
jgi:hypothetical protein